MCILYDICKRGEINKIEQNIEFNCDYILCGVTGACHGQRMHIVQLLIEKKGAELKDIPKNYVKYYINFILNRVIKRTKEKQKVFLLLLNDDLTYNLLKYF